MTAELFNDLAAQCEAATGADRALDHMIASVLNEGMLGAPLFRQMSHADWEQQLGNAPHSWVAAYTASLDAAATLIPGGMKWEVGFARRTPHVVKVWLGNGRGYVDGYSDHFRPLAICAAALRARAAQGIDARSGTTGTGVIGEADESPVAEGDAPKSSQDSVER